MVAITDVYEQIIAHPMGQAVSPSLPYGLIYLQLGNHGIELVYGSASQLKVTLDPDAVAPLLRAFANKRQDYSDPNGPMTSIHQLVQRLHDRTIYPLYLTDRIRDNMRKALARLLKRKMKALLESEE